MKVKRITIKINTGSLQNKKSSFSLLSGKALKNQLNNVSYKEASLTFNFLKFNLNFFS